MPTSPTVGVDPDACAGAPRERRRDQVEKGDNVAEGFWNEPDPNTAHRWLVHLGRYS